jgi:hypothetical protein
MSQHAFEAFTHGTADALSRRGSLMALSGVALAAGLAAAVGTEARQRRTKKARKKNRRTCNRAREGCRAFLLGIPELDSVDLLPCCENCFAGDVLTCLQEVGAASLS